MFQHLSLKEDQCNMILPISRVNLSLVNVKKIAYIPFRLIFQTNASQKYISAVSLFLNWADFKVQSKQFVLYY